MSALNCAAVIAAALILFPSATTGQTNSGELSGVVLGASGGVLPGAAVTATHPASGTVVARVTDAEGRFFLPALRVGVWDLKTWRLPRTSVLELRWEIFSVLNRANLDLPNRIFGSPDFGRISSAKNPREMQFGVRLAF